MDLREIASTLGKEMDEHAERLTERAESVTAVLDALQKATDVLDESRADNRKSAQEALEEWEGAGSERFRRRSMRFSRRIRNAGEAAEAARLIIEEVQAEVTGCRNECGRLKQEYTTRASGVLGRGLTVPAIGPMRALATVQDTLVPQYTKDSATQLRTAEGALAQAARQLRRMTKELVDNGVTNPGGPRAAGQRRQPRPDRKGNDPGKRDGLPPARTKGLENGNVPDSALSKVAGGELLKPAAKMFREMRAAAAEDGVDLRLNSGCRTYAEQAALYEQYQNGSGNLAAPPGQSNHGLGISADVALVEGDASHSWLQHNGATFGFVNDVPSEAWHWTYLPKEV